MNTLRKLGLAALAFLPMSMAAKIDLPEIISSNMVLQQQSKAKLWGKAKANAIVKVTPSWNHKTYQTKADASGNWLLTVETPKASYTPYSLQLTDGEATQLDNILIGDVWFCSGQSNMEMPLDGFTNCPIEGANDVIATSAKWKGIRVATIEHNGQLQPVDRVKGTWKVSSPENAGRFSATAYYFAMKVNEVMYIPIGIINCSWGGSKVEGWLPREIVETYSDIDLSKEIRKEGNNPWWHYLSPVIMYNGMLHPLENYTIKGYLWYQGESNVGHHDTYAQRLKTMVDLWRKEWGQGELPFYYVQIAPFASAEYSNAALLREAQFNAQKIISNSAMICTNDLVEPYEQWNVHPKNKQKVGERLAYVALSKTYGVKGIECESPSYREMRIENNAAILSFDHAKDGFNRMADIQGFEIAGSDRVFHPAKVEVVNNNQLKVSSDDVAQPVAVRYAFRDFKIGNVANLRELPLIPFRTDNW